MIPYRVLLERAADSPDSTAFISAKSREVSFSQLAERTGRLAKGIADAGIGKGDVVGALLPNCMEFVDIYIATGAVGAVFQPIDFRFQGKELKNTLVNTDVKMIFCHYSGINEALEAVIPASIQKVIIGGEKPGWTGYEKMFASTYKDVSTPALDEEKDIALFLYTSGSTSGIKCVPVIWRQLDFFPSDLIDTWGPDMFTRGISLLPLSHISGPIVINFCLRIGGSYVITDRLAPSSMIQLIEKYRVSWAHTVPSIAGLLLRGNPEKHDLSHFKFIALMGTSVPVSLLKELERVIPSAVAVQGYGLTETSPLITLETPQDHKKYVHIAGKEKLDEALGFGRGVIALTAHMGNFLILMTRLTLEGYDVDLLVKKMKDKKVEQGLQDLRQELTLVIEPPLELSRTGSKKKDMDLNVQKYTDVIQSYVQKYPDQWTWNNKQWAQ